MGANKKPYHIFMLLFIQTSKYRNRNFINIFDRILTKVSSKENTLVFCMVDSFNVNPSNYNVHTHTNDNNDLGLEIT